MDVPSSRVLTLKKDMPTCIAYFKEDSCAAVGTDNGRILILPLLPNIPLKRLEGHKRSITCIDTMHDRNVVISGSEDTTVGIWYGKESSFLRPNDGVIRSISVAQDVPRVVIAGEDGSPSIWDLEKEEPIELMKQFPAAVTGVSMSSDGKTYLIGCEDGLCRFYDSRSNNVIATYQAPDAISAVTISSECGLSACGCQDGTVTVYDYSHNQIIAERELHTDKVISMIIHPDSKVMVSSSKDKDIVITNPHNLKTRFSIEGNQGIASSLAWSMDADQFALVSTDKKVYLFRTPEDDTTEEEDSDDLVVEADPHVQVEKNEEYEEESSDEDVIYEDAKESEEDNIETEKIKTMKSICDKLLEMNSMLRDMSERVSTLDQQIVQIEAIQKKRAENY